MIADRLKELRSKQGLNQQKTADRLNITRCSYAAYEEGRSAPPASILLAIAALYGCTVDYLLGRDSKPPEEAKMFMAKFQTASPGVKECVMKLLE